MCGLTRSPFGQRSALQPASQKPPRNSKLQDAGWETMRAKLAVFAAKHGHCKVPTRSTAKHGDPKLGYWVCNQRKSKKRLAAGHKYPNITVERVAKLKELGFEYRLWANPESTERPDLNF